MAEKNTASQRSEARVYELRVIADDPAPAAAPAVVHAVARTEPEARRTAEAAMQGLQGPDAVPSGTYLDPRQASCDPIGPNVAGQPVGSISILSERVAWLRRWPASLLGQRSLN